MVFYFRVIFSPEWITMLVPIEASYTYVMKPFAQTVKKKNILYILVFYIVLLYNIYFVHKKC